MLLVTGADYSSIINTMAFVENKSVIKTFERLVLRLLLADLPAISKKK